MKIADIRIYHCHDGTRNSVFLQILTDEGITGNGQPYTVGPDEAILAAVKSSKHWFIGRDPTRIEWLLRRAKNTMRFPLGPVEWSFLSAIDHALWDIAGKAAGVPVYRLLGGPTRNRVRAYRQIHGDTPGALAEEGRAQLAEGYTAFKTSPYPPGWRSMPWPRVVREAAKRLEALRVAVGNGPDLAIDIHSTIREPAHARQLAEAVSPYRLMFVEEPVRPDYIPSTARLRSEFRTALATGENLFGVTQYAELMDQCAADIVQPDLLCCGGLLEARKIAAIAEANYVTVAPHNPLGLLSTALSVHLAASINNFVIMEYHGDHERPKARFVKNMWKPRNGYFELPTEPGLGMELDLEAIIASPPQHWNRGFPTYEDGSPAFI